MSRLFFRIVLYLILLNCSTTLSAQSLDENKKRMQTECARQGCAQEVSYWVGQSENLDPIMRHHETFMDAFIKYVQNRPIEIVGVVSTEATGGIGNESVNKSFNNETCRLETVSSVTYDGRETITISIGCGALVKYEWYTEESFSNDDAKQTETMLIIHYQEDLNHTVQETIHKYFKKVNHIRLSGAFLGEQVVTEFHYECGSQQRYTTGIEKEKALDALKRAREEHEEYIGKK